MLGRFFRRGMVRPGFFFPRGKIYTGILFPGAILSRGGFSGGKFYAEGNSVLQHRESNPDPLAPQAKTTYKFVHNNILIDLNTIQWKMPFSRMQKL